MKNLFLAVLLGTGNKKSFKKTVLQNHVHVHWIKVVKEKKINSDCDTNWM